MPYQLHLTWLLLLFSSHVASQTANKTVDDTFSYSTTNHAGIQYFPSESSWATTAPSDPSQRFNGTLHVTNASSTRAMFFFQGDEIYYYGDKGPGYGVVGINIDGMVNVYDTVNASSSTLEYQQLLWSKTGLGPGDHQIIISKNDTGGAGPISLDYFRIVQQYDHPVYGWAWRLGCPGRSFNSGQYRRQYYLFGRVGTPPII
ncbi:hypothetical protein FRC08_016596 [Ceratobasidium sp. 394]|nr:hypothetical protein FRC08_016596 [Ceratobasidium sp. 394]